MAFCHTKLVNLPQILSTIAISVLTVLATIIGIQVIILLKDLKNSLDRFNSVLNSAESSIRKLTIPITGVVGLVEGIKHSTQVLDIITGYLERHRKPEPPVDLD